MQEAAEQGKLPVPNLRNLDVYYEIGAELIHEGQEMQDEAAYRQHYRDKLAARDAIEPLLADPRLWPEGTA